MHANEKHAKTVSLAECDIQASNDLSVDDTYIMRPNYTVYDHQKISGCLEAIRNTIAVLKERAGEDQDVFDNFVLNQKVLTRRRTGHIHRQAQKHNKFKRTTSKKGNLLAQGCIVECTISVKK